MRDFEKEERELRNKLFELKKIWAKTSNTIQQQKTEFLISQLEDEYDRLQVEISEEKMKQLSNLKREKSKRIVNRILLTLILLILIFILVVLFYPSDRKTKESNNTESSEISTIQTSTELTVGYSNSSIYTKVEDKVNSIFFVKVSIDDLDILDSPTSYGVLKGQIPQGTYLIIEVKSADGLTWGKLANGQGWIALDYTTKVGTQDISSPENLVSNQDLLNEWSGKYSNWTTSVIYEINSDNTASVKSTGGEIKCKILIEKPKEELKIWGLILDDNGEPQQEKEYLANVIITLVPYESRFQPQVLYGVLLKNGRRELTDGNRMFLNKNNVYRR